MSDSAAESWERALVAAWIAANRRANDAGAARPSRTSPRATRRKRETRADDEEVRRFADRVATSERKAVLRGFARERAPCFEQCGTRAEDAQIFRMGGRSEERRAIGGFPFADRALRAGRVVVALVTLPQKRAGHDRDGEDAHPAPRARARRRRREGRPCRG
jgi:hypothetical protein